MTTRVPANLLRVVRAGARIVHRHFPLPTRKAITLPREQCWVCGRRAHGWRIELAHIEPRQLSPDRINDPANFIPLCRGGTIDHLLEHVRLIHSSAANDVLARALDSPVGCHDLQECGAVPNKEIERARALKGERLQETRLLRASKHGAGIVHEAYVSTKGLEGRAKAAWSAFEQLSAGITLERNRRAVRGAHVLPQCLLEACDAVKNQRRRAANTASQKAVEWAGTALRWGEALPLDGALDLLGGDQRTTVADSWQRLHYELGLALEAASAPAVPHEQGLSAMLRAEAALATSVAIAERVGLRSQANWTKVELLTHRLFRMQWDDEAYLQAETLHKDLCDSFVAGTEKDAPRWRTNWLGSDARMFLVRVLLGKADASDALERTAAYRQLVLESDVQQRSAMQFIHANQLDGMAQALAGNYEIAGWRLAQALKSMSGGLAKRPEGVRDALLASAWLITKCPSEQEGWSDDCRKLTELAGAIYDGRSGVWPEGFE